MPGADMDRDHAYFTQRAAAEWLAVAAASCDEARIAHAELARRYVEIANRSNNVIRFGCARLPQAGGKLKDA